jgi:hypothetical protein
MFYLSPPVACPRVHREGAAVVIFPANPPIQLPIFGEVYKVHGDIQIPIDKKWDRRAVVVGVPLDLYGRIRIVTRTSNIECSGVPSPEDLALDFDRPGVWGNYRSVEASLWVEPDVKPLGVLDPAIVMEICKYFRIQGTVS